MKSFKRMVAGICFFCCSTCCAMNFASQCHAACYPKRMTNLHCAAHDGDIQIVEQLLHKEPTTINACDVWQRTPLHWAADKGSEPIVKLLLDAGAHVNVQDLWGRTPLHWAAIKGHCGIIMLLLAAKGIDVHIRETYKRTALYEAAEYGHQEAVELLIAAGGNIMSCDAYNRTPGDIAYEKKHYHLVAYLKKLESEYANGYVLRKPVNYR